MQKEVKIEEPQTLKEEIAKLKVQLDAMSEMFFLLRKKYNKQKKKDNSDEDHDNKVFNRDGLPLNSSYIGYTQKSPYPYILIVDEQGKYKIANKIFPSLSSAAEFVSGVRRSGWTFWKLPDGRTLKEVYKDK